MRDNRSNVYFTWAISHGAKKSLPRGAARAILDVDSDSAGADMARIAIGHGIEIDESELSESFVRAAGPGGQNVNKVSTAVQLRFDVIRSQSLPWDVRERLAKLAGRRMTKDGELLILANRFRTQDRNREDARARLVELIARAAEPPPPPRRKTRPPKASKERRLSDKRKRSEVKRGRGAPDS